MNKWSEIRCDYCDDDGFWCVDAWSGDSDSDEGSVIAYIDDLTSRVIYVDPDARHDPYAHRIIGEKLHDLESNRIRVRREGGEINVYFDTAAGTLVAQTEQKENVGSDNIYVGINFPDHNQSYIDLVGVKVLTTDIQKYGAKRYVLFPMAFGDPAHEDHTYAVPIIEQEIDEALKEYD